MFFAPYLMGIFNRWSVVGIGVLDTVKFGDVGGGYGFGFCLLVLEF